MRRIKHIHVGNRREYGRFTGRQALEALRYLAQLSLAGGKLTVVYMDGSCFTVSPDAIEESEPDASSTEVA
jgi:hypothetical protein